MHRREHCPTTLNGFFKGISLAVADHDVVVERISRLKACCGLRENSLRFGTRHSITVYEMKTIFHTR